MACILLSAVFQRLQSPDSRQGGHGSLHPAHDSCCRLGDKASTQTEQGTAAFVWGEKPTAPQSYTVWRKSPSCSRRCKLGLAQHHPAGMVELVHEGRNEMPGGECVRRECEFVRMGTSAVVQ